MLGDLGLDENGRIFRMNSGGKVSGDCPIGLLEQHLGILPHGDRVEVHGKEDTVIVLLQLHPVSQGSDVVANRELTRRLDRRQHDFFLV